ncbi:hypothetical protein NEOC84_000419|uniref:gamma-glutamyl-gamma-aminobutyrate hydrolase family protein n=1 Tax=Neochlamydia sp. AcF84 TaxID=2315858 RepID=UPI001408DC33|nr:gamma-glutamyl-gamma-aminobutyrate hydrolase family protein [Neochlamydia sp. AcF84]NGY94538.1 hypothetical protein [Neochlamydia sp. AcF84]
MMPINSDEPFSCLRQSFLEIDPARKKLFLNQLSYSQREDLLKIIRQGAKAQVSKESFLFLKSQVKNIHHLMPNLTSTRNYSILSQMLAKCKAFVKHLLAFFNIMTAMATHLVAQKILFKNKTSVEQKPYITELAFLKLLQTIPSSQEGNHKINFAKLLTEHGYAAEFKNIEFSADFQFFKNADLEGIVFSHCTLRWNHFGKSKLENVVFQGCNLSNISFMNTSLTNCFFNHCEMREVMFTAAELHSTAFKSSSLITCSFEDAALRQCSFHKVIMPATHFLEAVVIDTTIQKSELKNTVFFGNLDKFDFPANDLSRQSAIISKPATAILVHPENRGLSVPKVFIKLDKIAGLLPLRITVQPQKLTKEATNQEANILINKVGPYHKSKTPIPQRIMQAIAENPHLYPSCASILKKAHTLASEVDSFFLPGGEDIPPALYGRKEEEPTEWDRDYRRSILELSMMHYVHHQGLPLMANCRGFQLANVYFGAQLEQHVEGHNNVLQILHRAKKSYHGLTYKALKKPMISLSSHHQGVPTEFAATEFIEPLIEYKGLVKASETEYSGAVPLILLQFHPEFLKAQTAHTFFLELIDKALNFLLSKRNDLFWKIFFDSANTHRYRKINLAALKNSVKLHR